MSRLASLESIVLCSVEIKNAWLNLLNKIGLELNFLCLRFSRDIKKFNILFGRFHVRKINNFILKDLNICNMIKNTSQYTNLISYLINYILFLAFSLNRNKECVN